MAPPPSHSTLDPSGPLARAIETLEQFDRREEVMAIQRLIRNCACFREEAIAARVELALIREEARQMREEARTACRVARQNLLNWKHLALILKSREELDRVNEALERYPFLRATAAA